MFEVKGHIFSFFLFSGHVFCINTILNEVLTIIVFLLKSIKRHFKQINDSTPPPLFLEESISLVYKKGNHNCLRYKIFIKLKLNSLLQLTSWCYSTVFGVVSHKNYFQFEKRNGQTVNQFT